MPYCAHSIGSAPTGLCYGRLAQRGARQMDDSNDPEGWATVAQALQLQRKLERLQRDARACPELREKAGRQATNMLGLRICRAKRILAGRR